MELGIPLEPPDAVKLLESGTVSWIDLGLAGDRYFGLMAGVGMDAAVVASMHPTMKRALKEAAFAVQGVGTYLTHDDPLFRVTCKERTVEGYFAVFGNSSNYGGAFGITPLADMRDGLLDVCVLKDKSFVSTVWYWTAALINAHIKHPKVEYFRTESALVAAVERRPGSARPDRRRSGRQAADGVQGRAARAARRGALTVRRPVPLPAGADERIAAAAAAAGRELRGRRPLRGPSPARARAGVPRTPCAPWGRAGAARPASPPARP